MAEGILKSFDTTLHVFSAGIKPEKQISPFAVKVLNEIGIDISKNYPKDIKSFEIDSFNYLITLSDNAKENGRTFKGKLNNKIHLGIDVPFKAKGTKDEILSEYRRIRNEIMFKFEQIFKLGKGISEKI